MFATLMQLRRRLGRRGSARFSRPLKITHGEPVVGLADYYLINAVRLIDNGLGRTGCETASGKRMRPKDGSNKFSKAPMHIALIGFLLAPPPANIDKTTSAPRRVARDGNRVELAHNGSRRAGDANACLCNAEQQPARRHALYRHG
ncbi:hypothetical protein EVAR_70616_1 [Eumeta japonica]|uniref:Uncharacterized protein n=1 Tax=Eumeta variegata TaxID=151549 RepID=A0A4C2A845_EUMVA|nr:hypothetical protein EVAR_70616_1 [Eumeta japonica]